MAGNFWQSSHCSQWLFGKETISQSRGTIPIPSSEGVNTVTFTSEEIKKLKLNYTILMRKLGSEISRHLYHEKRVVFPNRIISTAIVYFKRFYLKNFIYFCDPELLIPAAILLASKAEENPVNGTVVHKKTKELLGRNYVYLVQDILDCECYLMEEMDFDLIIFHPYRSFNNMMSSSLEQYISQRNGSLEDFRQNSWTLLNDSYHTDACLMYPPYIIALTVVYMSGIITRVDMRAWFDGINVDMKKIGDLTQEMYSMYQMTQDLDQDRSPVRRLRNILHQRHQQNSTIRQMM
eukprot:gb/GECH01009001.1/.p1 GENE.gb/GECH01009001.1/~~gb/GECH01009001.1/.p1  ORF type:complete len:292 (+),score=51.91 gb/GECH01009001.1/:1-876(+)